MGVGANVNANVDVCECECECGREGGCECGCERDVCGDCECEFYGNCFLGQIRAVACPVNRMICMRSAAATKHGLVSQD